METTQYIVTIEVCSSKVVGVLGEKDDSGSVSVTALVSEPLTSDCVRRGFVQNVEETKAHVAQVLYRLQNQIAPKKIQSVYVGIAGRSLHNIPVEIKQSLDPNLPISEDTIDDIFTQCRNMSIEGEILDVTPQQYLLDGNLETRMPIGSYSSSITAKMNLIVAKTALKTNLHRVFDTLCDVMGYIVTPLAVGDKTLSPDARQLGCMLLDFGAETTTVSIYKNDALQYIATLPMGSRLITIDITKMNIIETKAEDLKRTVGNATQLDVKNEQVIDGVKVSDISNYVQARIGEIGANIAAQFEYAKMNAEDISAGGIIIIGAGSRLNGFEAFLTKNLSLKVIKGQHCPYINRIAPEAENFEFIQSVALLAAAADAIDPDDNCVFTPKSDPLDPPADEDQPQPSVSEQTTPKEPGKVSRFFQKMKSGAINIFSGSDDDDEDDNFSDDDEKNSKY